MKAKHLLFGAAAAMMILGGCGTKSTSEQTPAASEHHHGNSAASGDIQETTATIDKLPSFLDGQDPKIVQAYQMVAAHKDLLQYIPCYCGCESIGHTSNRSCFIKEIKQDGSIVWDDHGTRCTTCMNIAVISSKMQENGQSPLEIRQFIDSKFKQGYAKPTPTPMPNI